jgi:hypothetical protein
MQSGEVIVRPDLAFNGLKVFSATMFADRDRLGEKVTDWMAAHRDLLVTRFVLTQSSDDAFHCIAITVFYNDPAHPLR